MAAVHLTRLTSLVLPIVVVGSQVNLQRELAGLQGAWVARLAAALNLVKDHMGAVAVRQVVRPLKLGSMAGALCAWGRQRWRGTLHACT